MVVVGGYLPPRNHFKPLKLTSQAHGQAEVAIASHFTLGTSQGNGATPFWLLPACVPQNIRQFTSVYPIDSPAFCAWHEPALASIPAWSYFGVSPHRPIYILVADSTVSWANRYPLSSLFLGPRLSRLPGGSSYYNHWNQLTLQSVILPSSSR
jgi:hypothetical protein